MSEQVPVSLDQFDQTCLVADEMRDGLVEARQELLAARGLHHLDGGWRHSCRRRRRSGIPREQDLKRLRQRTRDPVGDIRRDKRVSVFDRSQPPLANPNFVREFLLRGGAVAPIAEFLDLLSVELNFAPGVLLSNRCDRSCLPSPALYRHAAGMRTAFFRRSVRHLIARSAPWGEFRCVLRPENWTTAADGAHESRA
jgi:hypothetical protein